MGKGVTFRRDHEEEQRELIGSISPPARHELRVGLRALRVRKAWEEDMTDSQEEMSRKVHELQKGLVEVIGENFMPETMWSLLTCLASLGSSEA